MASNVLKTYKIDIFQLSNKEHDYHFEVDSSFFEAFENSILKKGKLQIHVKVDKSDNMIRSTFKIDGSVELVCDRSLEKYNHVLDITKNIIFKYAQEWKELSDDIITIPRNEQRLNVAQYIYEFVELAVPLKKLHPKYKEQGLEENQLVFSSEKTEQLQNEIDPRWANLNKLKKVRKV